MSKTIIIPLIVGFLLGAGFIWVQQPNTPEQHTETNKPSVTEESTLDTNHSSTEDEEDSSLEYPSEADVVYTLDTDNSTLGWSAYRLTGNGHTGTVGLEDGYLAYTDGGFLEGEFVIDMETITESENNDMFLNHIRSDDFFTVDKYPTSTIRITEVEESDREEATISGELTIRGITHDIEFPATIERTDASVTANAAFDIDRTRWGIVYDSGSVFKQLGDRAIQDDIGYDIDLSLSRVE